ncbi:hypothetical protein ElyMa_002555700 [Elysia marginata]|uniref:Uncharacterized protein n=1 Tax=Elysia marginata TaxID=1093978 RepID=A0AAV4GXF6_9GAST|nr:hypothetical protein ElyMa_002555700 [Elysia marginata]
MLEQNCKKKLHLEKTRKNNEGAPHSLFCEHQLLPCVTLTVQLNIAPLCGPEARTPNWLMIENFNAIEELEDGWENNIPTGHTGGSITNPTDQRNLFGLPGFTTLKKKALGANSRTLYKTCKDHQYDALSYKWKL